MSTPTGTPKKVWIPYSYVEGPYDFTQEDNFNPDYNPPDEYRKQVCEFMDEHFDKVSLKNLIKAAQVYYDKGIRNAHPEANLEHWCLQQIHDSFLFGRKTVFVDTWNKETNKLNQKIKELQKELEEERVKTKDLNEIIAVQKELRNERKELLKEQAELQRTNEQMNFLL